MRKGICPDCNKLKLLTKHSKVGHHRPPYIYICRKCHDKRHGIIERWHPSSKIQKGTKKFKRKAMLNKF